MNHSPLSISTTRGEEQRGEKDTRLHGGRLILMRASWGLLVSFALVFFVVNLPLYFTRLQIICVGTACADKQLTPAAAQALQGVGISIGAYAAFAFALTLFSAIIWLAVAGVLAWRKSDDWMALLVALMLVLQGIGNLTGASSAGDYEQLAISFSAELLNFFAFTALTYVLFLFPSGRFVPRWFAWLSIPFLANAVWYNFLSNGHIGLVLPSWVDGLSNLLFIGLVLSGGIAQIYGYRYVSTPTQRQQTKWVVFGLVADLVFLLGQLVPTLINPSLSQPGSLYNIVQTPITTLIILLIPLSFGIAILRHRLYDIDIIINRTLVYGSLTAILALLYFGLVFLLQMLLNPLTHNSALAVVGSTLVIAALFQPLRTRIQRIIDRRFYRSKYNATQTIANFSTTLRNEVELDELKAHLVSVVDETMQPTHISIWLRKKRKGE